ncbi:MAG: rod shape-determining protein MreC [Gemmatimonadota bacterium]
MKDYLDEPRRSRWRELGLGAAFVVVAFLLLFLPPQYQTSVRRTMRATVLRPFIVAQSGLLSGGLGRTDLTALRAQRDSLSAVAAAQASMAEENRRLRALLGLQERAGPTFKAAELVHVGMEGGESTFLLGIGSAEGVHVGSPVIVPEGLLGVVWEVGHGTAQGIDWTHPDFRASAMTADGQAYGIVVPRRGRFREEDRLALTGAPFHTDIPAGTRVVTSGRGGISPRGILIGTVVGVEEAETGWRKSYIVRPAVRPAAVTHVLVGISTRATDLSRLWNVAPADSTHGEGDGAPSPGSPG